MNILNETSLFFYTDIVSCQSTKSLPLEVIYILLLRILKTLTNTQGVCIIFFGNK